MISDAKRSRPRLYKELENSVRLRVTSAAGKIIRSSTVNTRLACETCATASLGVEDPQRRGEISRRGKSRCAHVDEKDYQWEC